MLSALLVHHDLFSSLSSSPVAIPLRVFFHHQIHFSSKRTHASPLQKETRNKTARLHSRFSFRSPASSAIPYTKHNQHQEPTLTPLSHSPTPPHPHPRAPSHAIVSSSVGPEYYVNIMSFVDKSQLEPGCAVLLHNKGLSIVGTLADDVDPMVSVMKVDKAPLESYADVGGLEAGIHALSDPHPRA